MTGLPSREEEGAVDGKGAPRPPRVRPRKLFLARPRAIRTNKAQIASTGRSPSLPRRQSPTGPPGQAAMRVTEPGSPAAELPPWATEKTEAPESPRRHTPHLFTPLRNSKSFCPSGMENTRITVPCGRERGRKKGSQRSALSPAGTARRQLPRAGGPAGPPLHTRRSLLTSYHADL